jgi:vesicle coat complex subunit
LWHKTLFLISVPLRTLVSFSNWIHCFIAVYDVSGAASDRNVVVLNDIHIDIMDYIVPASCNDTEFRQMWAEFEWENKVSCLEIAC